MRWVSAERLKSASMRRTAWRIQGASLADTGTDRLSNGLLPCGRSIRWRAPVPRKCLNCSEYLPDLECDFFATAIIRAGRHLQEVTHDGCTIDCVADGLFRAGLDPGEAVLRHRVDQGDLLQPPAQG